MLHYVITITPELAAFRTPGTCRRATFRWHRVEYYVKDELERRLHGLVCEQKIDRFTVLSSFLVESVANPGMRE